MTGGANRSSLVKKDHDEKADQTAGFSTASTQSGHRRGATTEAIGSDQKVKFVTTITSRSRNRPYYSNVG
jgi:hypothetical protein